MAFTLISAPDSVPTSTADWAKINNVLLTIGMALLSPARISGGNVIRGSVVHFAGAWYVTDSDTAISGTASNYVKLTNTAGTVTASYSANLTGVSWNKTWNGYYNAGGEYFIFDVMKARGAGLISDTYGLTFWQPQDAGMAKFLGSALSASSLSIPITNGSGVGVKFKRQSTSGGVQKTGAHTDTIAKTITLSTLNGVVSPISTIFFQLAWLVAAGQTVTINIYEGTTLLYTAQKTAGGSGTVSVAMAGNITVSARTLTVKFSATEGDPGFRISRLEASAFVYIQPSNPPTLNDIYAERIIGGIFDGESVITEDFS